MEIVESIKAKLLDANCPLIEANEDLQQIKTLLTENSQHKSDLIIWILQELSDSTVSLESVPATQKAFGLDFSSHIDCLKNWQLALDLIGAKHKYSENSDSLRMARHYLDFIHNGGLALPIPTTSLKSSLIPRDIEKDVLSRSSIASDVDLASMGEETLQALCDTLQKEVQIKQDQLVQLQESHHLEAHGGASEVNAHADALLKLMSQNSYDFEQDFRSWSDRIEAPKVNVSLENQIEQMHSQAKLINKCLSEVSALKRSAMQINENVKLM